MFVRCMLHRSYTAWRNECKPKPAGKITWQLRGECLIVGQSYCFVAVTAGFSMSQTNCLTILLATSALAPLYFAPLLSCVVVQITSPSLLTNRTEALASLAAHAASISGRLARESP